MPRIPVHYETFLITNGLRGDARAVVGRGRAHTVYRDAADREASDHDHHVARLTLMDPGDVSTFRAVAMQVRALFVVRCPGEGAYRFASLGIGATGKPEEDKEGLKVGDDLVRRGNGQLIVSDYDLMSVWLSDGGGGYERLPFTREGPGAASRWTNPDAERLFHRLNAELVLKLEHGANDDWAATDAKLREIRAAAVVGRRRYVAFTDTGGYRLLPDPGALRRYYADVLRADWPY